MSFTASRKHKKRSSSMSNQYQQNASNMAVQHQATSQAVVTVQPPPPPPPKRSESSYDQPRQIVEKDRYSDGEQWRTNERQGNSSALMNPCDELTDSGPQSISKSMRGERGDPRDEYNRSKTSAGLTKIMKNFFIPEPEDERHHEQRLPPGYYPSHDDRGVRPSKDSLMREIDRLEEVNHKLGQNNSELVKQLNQARVSVDKSAATTDRIQRTMDNKEHFLRDQALDDEVKSHFLRLMANIRTWTSKLEPCKPEHLDFSQLDDLTQNQLDVVVPACLSKGAEYWTDGRKMRMLFRGWLGYVVSQDILRVRTGVLDDNNKASDFWLPQQLRGAVEAVEDTLATAAGNISRKSFNNWRALSFELLSKVAHTPPEGEQRNEQEQFASRIMHVLKPFIPGATEAFVKDQLIQTIFIEAVKFSRLLRKQRPAWLVVDVEKMSLSKIGSMRGRVRYSPVYMDDDDLDDGEDTSKLSVKMFIAPALIKRGNSEGEDYDSRDCVVKALVVTA